MKLMGLLEGRLICDLLSLNKTKYLNLNYSAAISHQGNGLISSNIILSIIILSLSSQKLNSVYMLGIIIIISFLSIRRIFYGNY